MANQKITMLKLKRLLQLFDTGSSLNVICSELHMSKRTVHKYKQLVNQSGISISVLRQMENSQLESILQPPSPKPPADERRV
jgi:biotin operon repressor